MHYTPVSGLTSRRSGRTLLRGTLARFAVPGAAAVTSLLLATTIVQAPASASFDAASIGTRTTVDGVVVKTSAAPNPNIPPAPSEAEFYLTVKCPDLSCPGSPTYGPVSSVERCLSGIDGSTTTTDSAALDLCSLPPLGASTNSSQPPSDCQQYRSDYACTGYDPVAEQCDGDAQTVAAHTWHADYGPTLSSWERWSQSCQSNWSEFGNDDGGTNSAWAEYGSYSQDDGYGVTSTSYTVNSGTYVYGQLLYGGQGTQCVTALGDSGYFQDANADWRDSAGCV